MYVSDEERIAAEEEVKRDYRSGYSDIEPIGYFWETGIWSAGVEQPPRRTGIVSVEPLSSTGNVIVTSVDGNEYTLAKEDIVLF